MTTVTRDLTTNGPAADTELPPIEVQLSTLSWVGAVSAGGVEMVLVVADGLGTTAFGPLAAQVGVHLAAFTLLLALAGQLWRGHNWARWSLTGLFGLAGPASLLAGPLGWLARHDLDDLRVDPQFTAVAMVRSAHLACVVAAVVLMFLPAANRYLRRTA